MQWSEQNGYACTQRLFSDEELARIEEKINSVKPDWRIERQGVIFAMRNLLLNPFFKDLAKSRVLLPLLSKVHAELRPVRMLYFDKPFRANWNVLWHQDRTIAVKARIRAAGFSNWTQKKGIWHTEPPPEILSAMITVRIHFDDCFFANGALHFLPGSHQHGILSTDDISNWKQRSSSIAEVPRGAALLFRPLLLHSSKSTKNPSRRRVLHIEYAPDILPPPLQWAF